MRLIFFIFISLTLSAQKFQKETNGSSKAMKFMNALREDQKERALFPFEEINRFQWHYLPTTDVPRIGIPIREMSQSQKELFYELLKAYLSDQGYTKTKSIMDFEYLLKEMQPKNISRIPENYFIAIYGSPTKNNHWGWKLSGHHLALNFTIINDKLAFSPFFFGVYPAEVREGERKGTRILKDEEEFGYELLNSFSENQMAKSIIQAKTFGDIVTTNSIEVKPFEQRGIFASEMTFLQKNILNKLISAYLLSMPPKMAKIRMDKIKLEDIDDISFGWAGSVEQNEAHYYRIQGKTFLIEFDNSQANANHIHSVWRDFNGDFGLDLLKEHYQSTEHNHSHK